ncbi:hypothetical protein RFI_07822 [Reticulomyxa filosa]|uniref:Transmembrane protein n=1 Tax=Reticulomyxa filosa TaxID=46433 RepID=X6NTI9_RETFI|nr:hypothetical protein RFI_07822 [Reticulomyxa filosa]|eukprot:ETO29301.1 hypothetical protein RFI_07822 [Reticulomyxa filosa]
MLNRNLQDYNTFDHVPIKKKETKNRKACYIVLALFLAALCGAALYLTGMAKYQRSGLKITVSGASTDVIFATSASIKNISVAVNDTLAEPGHVVDTIVTTSQIVANVTTQLQSQVTRISDEIKEGTSYAHKWVTSTVEALEDVGKNISSAATMKAFCVFVFFLCFNFILKKKWTNKQNGYVQFCRLFCAKTLFFLLSVKNLLFLVLFVATNKKEFFCLFVWFPMFYLSLILYIYLTIQKESPQISSMCSCMFSQIKLQLMVLHFKCLVFSARGDDSCTLLLSVFAGKIEEKKQEIYLRKQFSEMWNQSYENLLYNTPKKNAQTELCNTQFSNLSVFNKDFVLHKIVKIKQKTRNFLIITNQFYVQYYTFPLVNFCFISRYFSFFYVDDITICRRKNIIWVSDSRKTKTNASEFLFVFIYFFRLSSNNNICFRTEKSKNFGFLSYDNENKNNQFFTHAKNSE